MQIYFFTFFCIHKKKVLDLRKFSASVFRWMDIFWDVLNTIWYHFWKMSVPMWTETSVHFHCSFKTAMKWFLRCCVFKTIIHERNFRNAMLHAPKFIPNTRSLIPRNCLDDRNMNREWKKSWFQLCHPNKYISEQSEWKSHF